MNTPKTILLIEDNRHDQFFFKEALREIENGTLFDIANNGKEALDKLEKAAILPNLIFSDINMPVMDGIECLAVIIKTPRIKHIPVVILSTDLGKMELAREMGARAFINKPDDCELLRGLLSEVINLDFMVDSYILNQTFHTARSGS